MQHCSPGLGHSAVASAVGGAGGGVGVGAGGSTAAGRQRDALRLWIRDQAQRLDRDHFRLELQGLAHPALSVLNRLIQAIRQLQAQVGSYSADEGI